MPSDRILAFVYSCATLAAGAFIVCASPRAFDSPLHEFVNLRIVPILPVLARGLEKNPNAITIPEYDTLSGLRRSLPDEVDYIAADGYVRWSVSSDERCKPGVTDCEDTLDDGVITKVFKSRKPVEVRDHWHVYFGYPILSGGKLLGVLQIRFWDLEEGPVVADLFLRLKGYYEQDWVMLAVNSLPDAVSQWVIAKDRQLGDMRRKFVGVAR